MKTKELKHIIKAMVRECINEVLAEKFIEHTIKESIKTKPSPIQEQAPVPRPAEKRPVAIREDNRSLIKKLGLEEMDPMRELFEDTIRHGEQKTTDAPGDISEASMEKIGLMNKDWTKYI